MCSGCDFIEEYEYFNSVDVRIWDETTDQGTEQVERIARAIAREDFELTCDAEEWDERRHYEVPIFVWKTLARAAIKELRENW